MLSLNLENISNIRKFRNSANDVSREKLKQNYYSKKIILLIVGIERNNVPFTLKVERYGEMYHFFIDAFHF